MRRIRKLIVSCIGAGMMALCGMEATAQTTLTPHTYIKVHLELNLDTLRLERKETRVFTPVLSDGEHRQVLRPLMVNGTWRHLLYLREQGKQASGAVRCGKRGAGRVTYVDSCLYRPWMKGAQLLLSQELCGCGGSVMEESEQALPTKMEEDSVTDVRTVVAETTGHVETDETVSHKVIQVTLDMEQLTFPVNSSKILPEFGRNEVELCLLTSVLDSLLVLPRVHINEVSMTGYASPDGTYRHNEELAYGRTLALREYLQHTVRYRELPFRTRIVAEDWEGLKAALEASEMPYREELLCIIGMPWEPDKKEARMKMIDQERAYELLKRDFFPVLRRTVCRIYYTEKNETK